MPHSHRETKFSALDPLFDRLRRRWAAVEARLMGRGGIACVAAATGMTTIRSLQERMPSKPRMPNRATAARAASTARDPKLAQALERLVDPVTRGSTRWGLCYACSSAARFSGTAPPAIRSASGRNRLLHELGYMQANWKAPEVNRRVRAFQRLLQPVVSVDTKKKELVGEYRADLAARSGSRCTISLIGRGKAIPYGIYDVTNDSGWVSVGEDHDTAVFAVETLRRWWRGWAAWRILRPGGC